MNDTLTLIGRLLLVAFFVFAGLLKLLNGGFYGAQWGMAGIPFAPALVVIVSLVELACAAAVAAGFRVRPAAFVLAAFSLIAIPVYFDVWSTTGDALLTNLQGVCLYLSMAGGFLILGAVRGDHAPARRA